MVNLQEMTDQQLETHLRQLRLQEAEQAKYSASIVQAEYDGEGHLFHIRLNNGLCFSFSPELVQEVCTLSKSELSAFRLDYSRTELQWPEQGTGLNVLSVLQGRFGTRQWMQKLHDERGIPLGEWPESPRAKAEYARMMGAVKSAKKSAAARRNGKKGGRPRQRRKETV